jgi:uncharacterized protein
MKEIRAVLQLCLLSLIAAGAIVLSLMFRDAGTNQSSSYQVRKSSDRGSLLQTGENTCGPTALQMIFDYFKIPSTVKETEQGVELTDEGTTMLALLRYAMSKGLHAEGWRLSSQDFIKARFPVILFVSGNHFVVADSIRNSVVFIRDPAKGKVAIPFNDLTRIWKGETLIFMKK